MMESENQEQPLGTRVCSVDSASTCLPQEGSNEQTFGSDDPLDCSFSSFTHSLVACLKDVKGEENGVYTQAEIRVAAEKALAQQKHERGILLLITSTVLLLLAFFTGGCSLYSAIQLSQRPPMYGSPKSISYHSQNQLFAPSTGSYAQQQGSASRWGGFAFPSGALVQFPDILADWNYSSSVNSTADGSGIFTSVRGYERIIPLYLLTTVPFETLLRISVVLLHLNDNETRGYRVATVSRNVSTNSTAIEFVTRETLVMQPEGLAVLLAPSNTILAGWNIEPPENGSLLSSLLSVAGGHQGEAFDHASPSVSLLSSAAKPLTDAQVSEWLLRRQSDLVTGQSSYVGQPIEETVVSVPTSSTTTKAPAHAFPLTDEQYKEMDMGEPLLEGFPVLPPSTNELNNTEEEPLHSKSAEMVLATPAEALFLQNRPTERNIPAVVDGGSTSSSQNNDHDDATKEGSAH